VHLFFLVPENAAIKSIKYKDQKMADVTLPPPATKPS
jgi:hypothetical protein